jgi:hypothetical protein
MTLVSQIHVESPKRKERQYSASVNSQGHVGNKVRLVTFLRQSKESQPHWVVLGN